LSLVEEPGIPYGPPPLVGGHSSDFRLQSLKVSPEEISFMQEISALIGDSPRTLKRYINIYRIIRTHARFETTAGEELDYHCAAMMLLAVITGMPLSVQSFFDHLRAYDAFKTFQECLTDYLDRSAATSTIGSMNAAIAGQTKLKYMGTLQISVFQKNLTLISRFSFRMTF
jgi:hypothetical protein